MHILKLNLACSCIIEPKSWVHFLKYVCLGQKQAKCNFLRNDVGKILIKIYRKDDKKSNCETGLLFHSYGGGRCFLWIKLVNFQLHAIRELFNWLPCTVSESTNSCTDLSVTCVTRSLTWYLFPDEIHLVTTYVLHVLSLNHTSSKPSVLAGAIPRHRSAGKAIHDSITEFSSHYFLAQYPQFLDFLLF